MVADEWEWRLQEKIIGTICVHFCWDDGIVYSWWNSRNETLCLCSIHSKWWAVWWMYDATSPMPSLQRRRLGAAPVEITSSCPHADGYSTTAWLYRNRLHNSIKMVHTYYVHNYHTSHKMTLTPRIGDVTLYAKRITLNEIYFYMQKMLTT